MKMKKSEADALVATIRGAYPNQEMPEATANLLVAHLRDLEADVGAQAIDRVIRQSQFLPSIAELTEAEEAVRSQREEAKIDESVVAWAAKTYHVSVPAARQYERERCRLIRAITEGEIDWPEYEDRERTAADVMRQSAI